MAERHIAVVGAVMLDIYLAGEVDRIEATGRYSSLLRARRQNTIPV